MMILFILFYCSPLCVGIINAPSHPRVPVSLLLYFLMVFLFEAFCSFFWLIIDLLVIGGFGRKLYRGVLVSKHA